MRKGKHVHRYVIPLLYQTSGSSKTITTVQNGITLIEVPFRWDRTNESLAATIHSVRPELLSQPPNVEPIPKQRPNSNSEGKYGYSLFLKREGISSLLSHAQIWDGIKDVTGW